MRALLIGGTGPTGPIILDGLIKRGYETCLLHRGHHEIELPHDVEHLHVDPHFEDSLAAGLAGRKFDLVIATYGRLRLLPAVLRGKTSRIVTVGGAAYADTRGRYADESAPRDPSNKMVPRMVETEAVLMKAHAERVFDVTHLRYPGLFGPRQLAPREWSIIRRIRDGRRVIPVLDGGLTLESKAYIVNAATAVLLAADNPDIAAGQIYNVADEYAIAEIERVRVIAGILGADVEIASLPLNAGAPAYWWGSGRDNSFAQEGRPPHMFHKLISSDKIRRQLGYRDAVDFKTAMQETVAWYLEHPLVQGSEQERQLGDPFDYRAEDAYLDELRRFETAVKAIPFAGVSSPHPYAHPARPEEQPR